VLEETNEGIDRNFKSLQKTETSIKNAENIINSLSDQFDALRTSIEFLASQNEKASEAVEKVSTLDASLAHLEKRIADMDVAREWLARTETELNAVYKEAKEHLNLTKALYAKEGGKAPAAGKGPPAPRERENVFRLKNQGFKNEEIANALGLSIGEVGLILELGSRR